MANKRWSYQPKPVKLAAKDKSSLETAVKQAITSSPELSQRVYRFEVRAGRIYFYKLCEQFGWDDPEARFIKPLIEGKFAEFPMARITLFDVRGDRCETAFQRHTGEWVSLYEGKLVECLVFIEENEQWF